MSEKVVRIIPLKKEVVNNTSVKKRRVCGYARVSTDNDEQTTSYNSQVEYYTSFIKKNPEWDYVGLYSDEGISGVSTKDRVGFKKMIFDAKQGLIDLIITKSISRFARNTVDALQTIRELKEANVEVYFEKENIWTFDTKGELMLSILSSLAQDESRSISENVQWGIKKRFADGHARLRSTNFLGYKKDDDGNVVIDTEEAKVVKKIYKWFLDGQSYATISKFLMKDKIKTPAGFDYWRPHIVKSILTNERYSGDALCQKYYTVDFMRKYRKKNDGKVEQYYIENNHDAIIDKEVFNIVQEEIKKRSGRITSKNIIGNKMVCGYCGDRFSRNVRVSKDGDSTFYYTCLNKTNDGCFCRLIYEEDVKKMFMDVLNKTIENKAEIIIEIENELKKVCDYSDLERRKEAQDKRLELLVDKLNQYIYKSAKVIEMPDSEKEQYKEDYKEFKKASKTTKRLEKELKDVTIKRSKMTRFLEDIKKQEKVDNFTLELWGTFLDKFIVYNDKIIIKLYDGKEHVISDFSEYPKIKPVLVPSTHQINKLNLRIKERKECKEVGDENVDSLKECELAS